MSICDPALRTALRTLKLSGMLDTLDARQGILGLPLIRQLVRHTSAQTRRGCSLPAISMPLRMSCPNQG